LHRLAYGWSTRRWRYYGSGCAGRASWDRFLCLHRTSSATSQDTTGQPANGIVHNGNDVILHRLVTAHQVLACFGDYLLQPLSRSLAQATLFHFVEYALVEYLPRVRGQGFPELSDRP
jgi:hypothetical protein